MKVSMVGGFAFIRASIVGLFRRGGRPGGALVALAVLLAVGPAAAQAQERLAHVFQDNMVLQREKPVPVWGWAKPGAAVEVAFGGQKKEAKADDKGYWKAVLDPLTASREGRALEVRIGETTLSRKNVLVGEVWLATGQSNMCAGGPDLDTGVYPRHVSPGTKGGKPEIRVCTFGFGASLEPLADIDEAARGNVPWSVFQEDPPPAATGLAQYFARVVRDALDVPVGIVHVAVPGTNQAAWMARETLESFPGDGKSANFYQEFLASHADKVAKGGGKLNSWEAFKEAETAWRQTKKGPWPTSGLTFYNYPGTLYNTRIHPLAPFALRGAIWHQGEAGPPGPYGQRLVAMVKQWRGLFGQDFCFIWGTLSRDTVQVPPLAPLRTSFYRSGTNGQIRLALGLFGEARNVALVEFYDLGDESVHFTQKAEAGRRMALAALTVAHGQNHLYTSPRMVETKIEPAKAVVRFTFVGDGLVYQPSIDGLSGVYLRGKSGTVRWAQVKVTGKDTVEVSHPDIADLETVAYGDNPNPHETLFSSAGLPAAPFTVNPGTGAIFAGKAPPSPLLTLPAKSEAVLNFSHLRRSGYVFQLKPPDKKTVSAPVAVQAYIPAEWPGFEVELGGKKQEAAETTKDGQRYVTFNVPVDGTWAIVSEAGKAAEFRKINRY